MTDTTPAAPTTTLDLPTLTDDELATLGDDPLLRDAETDHAREEMSDEVRDAVDQSARRGLVARGLLTPTEGGYDLDAAASLILRTRHTPLRLIVVQDVSTDDDVTLTPPLVAHGVDAGDDGPTGVLDGFVVDAHARGMHDFRLATVTETVDLVALWLVRPPEEGEASARSLELMLPGPDGAISRRRWIADVAGEQPRVAAVSDDGTIEGLLPEGGLAPAIRDALEIA